MLAIRDPRLVEDGELIVFDRIIVALARLRELEKARDEAKAVMDRYLRELGYEA